MKLKNLRLKWKFSIAFGVVVLLVMVMCATVITRVDALNSAMAAQDHQGETRSTAAAALADLAEQQNAVRGYVATGDASFIKKIEVEQAAFNAHAVHLEDLAGEDAGLKARVADLIAGAAEVRQQEDAQIRLRRDPATVSQAQASILTTGRLTKIREVMTWIAAHEDALVTAASERQAHAIGVANVSLWLGGLLTATLAAFTGWTLTVAVERPVTLMTVTMRRLAAGDHAVDVPETDREDEIGAMACAVLVFRQNAVDKISMEQESAAQVEAAAIARRKAEADVLQNERRAVVGSVGEAMTALSRGDLTYRMPETLPDEYEQLRIDFNAAMVALQETIKVLTGNTATIRSGAEEIANASQDLSRRTERQAASLGETAAALDEITATVRKTAEGSKHARDVVGSTKVDAERSGEVVRDAVVAMSGIEKSSQEISQIIGVIDEIAFQTNLLALNAGVEAARAGDAGRGFAVVAQEVRALAQRSAGAAKEIKTLISTSGQQVKAGVSLVGDTGEALQRIVVQVAEINEIVVDIAASATEQAAALNEVNSAINQMDQVIQQNAAMVEQATAASRTMSQETEELGRLIGQFQVGEAVLRRENPARTPGRPPAAAKAMKPTAACGAARKPVPAPMAPADSDNWEEF